MLFRKEHIISSSVDDTSSFVAHFRILPKSPFPIIIERATIKKFNLVLAFPSHFFCESTVREMLNTTNLLLPMPNPVDGSVNDERDNSSQALHDTPRVGCAVRPFGGHTDSEWSSDNLVNNREVQRKSKLCRELMPGGRKGIN